MATSCLVVPGDRLRTLMSMILAGSSLCGCATISPPVTEAQVTEFSARLNSELSMSSRPNSGPMTVDDAVASAIANNETARAKELETILAEAKATAQIGAILPKLLAESDYYRRDRPQMSRAAESQTYSTSFPTTSISRDITLSWNILDFGLSYIRYRQGLAKAHQQHEEMRRIRARIAEETRSTFWKAVALQYLAPAMARLNREVESALVLAQDASQNAMIDPLNSINYQRDILNLQRELNQILSSIAGSHEQLKQLTGLQGSSELRLDSSRHTNRIGLVLSSTQLDVAAALGRRPEIRQHMYDLRITQDEIDATILQVLPGVTFTASSSSDLNPLLLYASWASWGAKIVGNLMSIARLDADLDVVDRQGRLHRQSALATAATIVMQVHVARARMAVEHRNYRDAQRFADVQRRLLAQIRTAVESGKAARQAVTRERLATLLAEVRAMLAFAELQAALASYATAKGDDPIITKMSRPALSVVPARSAHARLASYPQ